MATTRILLVDDETDILNSLKTYLEVLDYEVFTESDPLAALDRVGIEQIDVVITDINMPGMDGIELLRRMKAERPLLQVIMITAYSTVDKVLECLTAGASDYLLKPLADMEEATRIIEEASNRVQRWRRTFMATVRTERSDKAK